MTSPMVHPETPRVAVACGCILGEGVVWDHRTETLLWVDIKKPAVWRWRPAETPSCLDVGERVGFVALTSEPEVVVAGFKSGLKILHLITGETTPIVSPEPDKPGNRINDGHVGPNDVLYFGTMDDAEEEASGAFWRWDGQDLASFVSGVPIANGPATSADGQTLYTVNTRAGTISAHALRGRGVPGPASPVIRFEEGWGHPDGLAVDAEDHLWACHWGASRITRFRPDGTIERILPIPTAQVTKCAFGGPGLTRLYITTAAIGRDPHIDPMAGHVFVVETGIEGQPAHILEAAAPA